MRDRLAGFEIHLIVLDGSPEALDKDVVMPTALAVHADTNAIRLELSGKFAAGELAALVSIEDFRRAATRDRFLQGLDAEIGGQRVRQAPSQNPATVPIDDGGQIRSSQGGWFAAQRCLNEERRCYQKAPAPPAAVL